jgi:hypothetical protein
MSGAETECFGPAYRVASCLVEKKIFTHATNWLVYGYDGGAVNLPIAKHLSKRYKGAFDERGNKVR